MKQSFMDENAYGPNKETFTCYLCNKTFQPGETCVCKMIFINGTNSCCKKCLNDVLNGDCSTWIFKDGRLYNTNALSQQGVFIRRCSGCGKRFVPSEESLAYYANKSIHKEDMYCFKCRHNRCANTHYCFKCGCYHEGTNHFGQKLTHNFKRSYGEDGHLSFTTHKESKSWNTRGTETMYFESSSKYKDLLQLPYQEERALPEDIIDEIDSFYGSNGLSELHVNNYTRTYNYRDKIYISGEINLRFGSAEKKLKEFLVREPRYYDQTDELVSKLKGVEDCDIEQGYKQNKYKGMYFDSIDDEGYIVWKYVDIFGNIKTKKEGINTFYQNQGCSADNSSVSINLKYILSSDLNHKLDAFIRNDEGNFNSCQRASNSDGLSRGAYDTITNGCICPILIYKKDNMNRAVGRITTRIMYDKDGEMYILLERLYHDGTFSNGERRGLIYKEIALDLKKQGYKVVVSNYSAHDESTLAYLQTLGLKYEAVINDLYQPLRQLIKTDKYCDNDCGYYADGGTECISAEINGIKRTTDYLDKAYLI